MLLIAVVLFMGGQLLYAQTKDVSGVISNSEDGSTVPGASIMVQGTTLGTITDIDGNFSLQVPADAQRLIISFVGLKTTEVQIGNQLTFNVILEPDIFGLDEVVVTGVASGTPTKKLGFEIGKVSDEQLEEVPAIDAANAIRGKVAGVRVVQASGNPSSAAEIRLRGSTSIVGGQSPLIIVDGIITSGSLSDINMEDVKSIEIIKGSAGSSLYGSLAGNGVIQIITKRGSTNTRIESTKVTVKNEYGQSFLNSEYPLTNSHYWQSENGVRNKDLLDVQVIDPSGDPLALSNQRLIADNPYHQIYDHPAEIYTPQPYYTNYVSVSHNTRKMQFHSSFENKNVTGIVEGEEPWVRKNFRMNVDFTPDDKWKLSVSTSYNTVDGYGATERGQGSNIFYSTLMAEPHINFLAKVDGEYVNTFEDYDNNWHNPLYVAANRRIQQNRDRVLGGIDLSFKPIKDLTLLAQYSMDRTDYDNQTFYPIGYVTPGVSSLNFGSLSMSRNVGIKQVASFQGRYQKQLGDDLNASFTAKYLLENQHNEGLNGNGTHFASKGVRTLNAVSSDSRGIGSYIYDYKAENVFGNLVLDYQDKLIFDGLVRRDGASQFGEDNRYALYFRTALSYILSEDVQIEGIDFMKLRASYGTSGQRPGFAAQYETYNVSSSGITPGVLGNKDLMPSTVAALEVGFNVNFLERFEFSATYETTEARDQFLAVPLSKVAGYTSQWQNAGTMESTALEFSFNGDIVRSGDFKWNIGITWDKITQEITELGRPAWTLGTGAIAIFRVEEDKAYGTMYGNQTVQTIDQLRVDAAGHVMNDYGYVPGASTNLTVGDFKVNEDGYVIVAANENTRAEQVHLVVDETGTAVVSDIGESNPDFNFGLSNTFSYKGVSLYVLFEGQQGGDIYSYTRQLMNFNDRHGDFETYAAMGKSVDYHNGSSALYNKSDAIDYYVEDGSYVKMRELALSYKFKGEDIGLDKLSDVRVGIIGRNLLTFTDYSGFDPEVSFGNNATNFRVDEYTYPHFATWTASLTLNF